MTQFIYRLKAAECREEAGNSDPSAAQGLLRLAELFETMACQLEAAQRQAAAVELASW